MVVFHNNFQEVIAGLKADLEDYRATLEQGFAKAGRLLVDRFREQQLSGRSAGDMGLNIRTGNLFQSLRSLTEIEPRTIRSIIFNRGAQYWAYHQDGTGTLPKRLTLEEDFEDEGSKMFTRVVEQALEAWAR